MSSSASSSSSSFPSPTAPLWKGTDERAAAPARFVEHLFSCTPSTTSESLGEFIAYAMNRTLVPPAVLTGALVLLARLKGRFAQAKAASANRLFLAAFMIAQKQLCDGSFSSASWCIVARGRWSLRDVNRMEKEFLEYLAWSVTLNSAEMSAVDHVVYRDFCRQPMSSTVPVSAPFQALVALPPPTLPTPSLAAPADAYPSPVSCPSYSPAPSSPEQPSHAMYSSFHSSPASARDTPLHTPSHSATPSECDDSDWSPSSSSPHLQEEDDDDDEDDMEDDAAAEYKRKAISSLRRATLTPATAPFLARVY